MDTLATEFGSVLWCLAAGAAAGAGFDIFRLKRRVIRTGVTVIQVEDGLFWLLATLIGIFTLQQASGGEIRIYLLLAMTLGCSLYLTLSTELIWKRFPIKHHIKKRVQNDGKNKKYLLKIKKQ